MTDADALPLLELDIHSPEFAADLDAQMRALRANGLTWSPRHGGFYVLARYDDVRRAALDTRTFTSARDFDDPTKLGVTIPASERLGIPSEVDPPVHTAYRRALAPFFTAKGAEALRARIEHWTTVCLDAVIERGRIDIIQDLTAPVAFIFFCELVGIPIEDWRRWQRPFHVLMAGTPGTPEYAQAHEDERANVRELHEMVEERREHPRDDLLSGLARAEVDGERLPTEIVAGLSVSVMTGAVDTVGSVVGQALHHLVDRPDERRRLIEDRALLPSAVEEFLRYFSPNTALARTIGVRTELYGRTLEPGDRVLLAWMAANRDPAAFEDPETIVLDRRPNRHLSFGAGIHKCVGLHLARIEAATFLEQVLTRLPDYRIVERDVVRMPTVGVLNGYFNLPAEFTPGRRVQHAVGVPGGERAG